MPAIDPPIPDHEMQRAARWQPIALPTGLLPKEVLPTTIVPGRRAPATDRTAELPGSARSRKRPDQRTAIWLADRRLRIDSEDCRIEFRFLGDRLSTSSGKGKDPRSVLIGVGNGAGYERRWICPGSPGRGHQIGDRCDFSTLRLGLPALILQMNEKLFQNLQSYDACWS